MGGDDHDYLDHGIHAQGEQNKLQEKDESGTLLQGTYFTSTVITSNIFFFSRGNTIINARRSGVRSHAVLLVRDDRRLVRLRVLLPPHVVRAIAHQGKLAQKKEFVCCLQFKKGSVTLMYDIT